MFRDTSAQDQVLAATAPAWRRRAPWIAGGAALLAVLVLAEPRLARLLSAQASVSASRLGFATVVRGDFVRDVVAEAQVVAADSPTLYAQSAGTVSFKVHAGDAVKKDQVLATLDSPELTNKLAQEKAVLGGLEVDYRGAQLDARRQQLTAQENFDRAQVDQQTAAREVDRSEKAYQEGAYSELNMLRAKDTLEKSNFDLAHARKDLELAPEQIRFAVQSKQLARDREVLLVAELQRQVDNLNLRSPADGQIGQLLTAERTSVAPNAALLTVIDLSSLELEMKVPESEAHDLAVNMPAQIDGGSQSWKGLVGAVSPEVVSGEVAARIRFADGTPDGLRQNQRLSVRVVMDQRQDVLSVARGPWYDAGGGHLAYVVKDGMAERRTVSTGAASLSQVEILGGLQPGEQIVTSGTDAFNNAPSVVISR